MERWLKRNPKYTRSKIQILFEEMGWMVIFTPPYCHQYQPIELVWANVKGYVARTYTNDRSTMPLLREAIVKGFGGDTHDPFDSEFVHKGITAELCRKLIARAERFMNNYIIMDEHLDGSINDLTVTAIEDEPIFYLEDDEAAHLDDEDGDDDEDDEDDDNSDEE